MCLCQPRIPGIGCSSLVLIFLGPPPPDCPSAFTRIHKKNEYGVKVLIVTGVGRLYTIRRDLYLRGRTLQHQYCLRGATAGGAGRGGDDWMSLREEASLGGACPVFPFAWPWPEIGSVVRLVGSPLSLGNLNEYCYNKDLKVAFSKNTDSSL